MENLAVEIKMFDRTNDFKINFDSRGIVTDVDDYDGLAYEEDLDFDLEEQILNYEPSRDIG
jgi:hypothetical protein